MTTIVFSQKEINRLFTIANSMPDPEAAIRLEIVENNGVGTVKSVIVNCDITDYDAW